MVFSVLLLLFNVTPSFAGNVIIVTIDGVRPEDASRIFANSAPYSYSVQVSNSSAKSLPGYRALFSGNYESQCTGNYSCENIDRETLIDHFVDGGLDLNRIAAFASWKQLGLAIESKPRIIRSISGKLEGPVSILSDDLKNKINSLNLRARSDLPPWKNAIKDIYTWSLAMLYLNMHHPRFLYIGLLDTDEWGHQHKKIKYLKELRLLKNRIEQLQMLLAQLGDYGRDTSIVLTTDHGRGRWPFFSGHGKNLLHSFRAWARVYPSQNRTDKNEFPTKIKIQTDIRPLLQTWVSDLK